MINQRRGRERASVHADGGVDVEGEGVGEKIAAADTAHSAFSGKPIAEKVEVLGHADAALQFERGSVEDDGPVGGVDAGGTEGVVTGDAERALVDRSVARITAVAAEKPSARAILADGGSSEKGGRNRHREDMLLR